MTDTHKNDDNTSPRGNERTEFDLNPDYTEYGIETLDDGAVILRIDSEKHLFERAGLLRHKQAKIVLKEYIDTERLGGEGSFETVESIPARGDDFESRLQDGIVELIYDNKVDEEQAKSLAETLPSRLLSSIDESGNSLNCRLVKTVVETEYRTPRSGYLVASSM